MRPIVEVRPIVEAAAVSRSYGARLAVDGIDFALCPGELTFLVGPSGAGKTTLLKLINREIRPTTGQLWVAGLPAHLVKPSRVAELRRKVGVVFQDFKLLPRLTAAENVAFGLRVVDLRLSDQEARERSLDALEAVGLGDRGDAFPHQLSGGQQQRVAIARAVVAQPPVLIADELTGNLDQETAWEIMDLYEVISACGPAVLVATIIVEIEASQASLLHVYLRDDADGSGDAALKVRIESDPRVQGVVYVSKNDALARARTVPGLPQLADATESNPFPASLDVQVRSIDDMAAIDAMVRHESVVDPAYPTSYDRGAYQRIQAVLLGVAIAGFAFIGMLGFVAVAVTMNSIKAAIHSRRDE